MLLIDCPLCGPRDETEFVNGGEGHLVRPGPADAVSDEEWAAYLFLRANPRGALAERWCHLYGCRTWFHASRDTHSHAFAPSYGIGEAPVQPE